MSGLPASVLAKVVSDLTAIRGASSKQFHDSIDFALLVIGKIEGETARSAPNTKRPTSVIEELLSEYGMLQKQNALLASMVECCIRFLSEVFHNDNVELHGTAAVDWETFIQNMMQLGLNKASEKYTFAAAWGMFIKKVVEHLHGAEPELSRSKQEYAEIKSS